MASTKTTSVPLQKSQEDEPIFVLTARDPKAPELVREWAFRWSVEEGVPTEKVVGARAVAVEMEIWQQENPELVKRMVD